MSGAHKTFIIEAPIETVYAVIVDYARYPEFLKDIVRVEVNHREGSVVQATYWLNAVVKEIRYTLRHFETPLQGIRWELVDGQMMKSNTGSWQLESLGARQTRATYTLEVGIKGFLVPQTIVNSLTEVTLPRTLEGFKKRAEQLAVA